jgi:hypothetical protein
VSQSLYRIAARREVLPDDQQLPYRRLFHAGQRHVIHSSSVTLSLNSFRVTFSLNYHSLNFAVDHDVITRYTLLHAAIWLRLAKGSRTVTIDRSFDTLNPGIDGFVRSHPGQE